MSDIQFPTLTDEDEPSHNTQIESLQGIWISALLQSFIYSLLDASHCGAAAKRRIRDRKVPGLKLACAICAFSLRQGN